MTKGKKIAIAIAIILGIVILVVGVFTKPQNTKTPITPGAFAKNQVEKLDQMQQLTNQLYNDEDTTTDMAQLKSQIDQIGGSMDSLYQGMISSLESAKSQIGQQKYQDILNALQNNVEPSYKLVISDANEIVKNTYDANPGQTVIHYQNALKAMTDAENVINGNTNN